jgi:NAD(P)-dependent dehydrogenase (short-subunit alcohol dehydrogenase family)
MKSVIVTGASGNLGKAVATKFFNEGYNVAGTIHRGLPSIQEVNEVANETFVVDLEDEAKSDEFIQSVVRKYQQVDVVVLTAGGFTVGKIASTTVKDLLKQIYLNFVTAYTIARPVFLQMIKQNSGHIFLIGSMPGLDITKGKGSVAYALSKTLLFRLAELLNEEGASNNVRVSVVVPAVIDTPQNRQAMPSADFSNWTSPEKIADVIFSHASGKTPFSPSFFV